MHIRFKYPEAVSTDADVIEQKVEKLSNQERKSPESESYSKGTDSHSARRSILRARQFPSARDMKAAPAG
jgi:hypothetical protein